MIRGDSVKVTGYADGLADVEFFGFRNGKMVHGRIRAADLRMTDTMPGRVIEPRVYLREKRDQSNQQSWIVRGDRVSVILRDGDDMLIEYRRGAVRRVAWVPEASIDWEE